jgi:hypothetical protein
MIMGHAFDLQTRLAEIKQQAKLQAGHLAIIGALHQLLFDHCFEDVL